METVVMFRKENIFPVALSLLIGTIYLLPASAAAITQYSCPTGSALTWERTSTLLYSDWTCVDGTSGARTSPATTNVEGNSCASGYRLDTTTWGSAICVPTSTEGSSGLVAIPPQRVSCSGTWNNLTSPGTCLFRAAVAGIGSLLISMSAWVLQLTGLVFNWLVYHTIIIFGADSELYGTIKTGVESTWTAFRDIANILIIGLFTFIALSIILGLKEFGQKKMIASVLIIAVLINFSLLFTKMIIDASNFTSYQFYKAAIGGGDPTASDSSALTGTLNFTQQGIAGQILQFMGVTSVAGSFDALKKGADALDNGWIAFFHGVFAALILLGAAAVLAYGCFLLIGRAIMVVFLLITSSLAFASYLIPGAAHSNYGWGAWKSGIIQVSVFAPLLMLLLWVTLVVGKAVQPEGGSALGALVTNPTNAASLSSFFNYLLILGMLYASFKIASSFANSASGLNFASLLGPRLAIGAAAIGQRAWSPIARNTIGRSAAARARVAEEETKAELARVAAQRAANQPYSTTDLTRLLKKQQSLEANARRDFHSTQLKDLATRLGVPGVLAGGKGVGGYAGKQKAHVEEAAKAVSSVSASPEKIKEAIEQGLNEQQRPLRAAAEKEREAAGALVESARANADAAKRAEQLQEKKAAAEEHARNTERSAQQQKIEVDRQHREGAIDRTRRNSLIQEQDERIKSARQAVTHIDERIGQIENEHIAAPQKRLEEAHENIRKLDTEFKRAFDQQAKDITKASNEVLGDVAVNLSHSHGTTAEMIREQVAKNSNNKRLKNQFRLQREVAEELGEGGEKKTDS